MSGLRGGKSVEGIDNEAGVMLCGKCYAMERKSRNGEGTGRRGRMISGEKRQEQV
jgi:hypothetical protein